MRSIPAWAGVPGWKHTRGALYQVYPRVGGGTQPFPASHVSNLGLSPRGRGNRTGHQASAQ